MTTIVQRSFSGGEIAPGLYARTDQTKYATGVRTLRNMIVQKHGGARLRPGTGYVGEVKDSAKTVRLMKFVFNDAQTYVMEFGDRYIRWMQLGGRIVTAGVAAWVTATVYGAGDLVTRGGVTYYAIAAHTSGATSEPGVGATWPAFWAAQTGTIYEIPSPYLAADLPALQIVQSADVITITHPGYLSRELQRYSHTKWILTTIVHGPSISSPTNLALGGGAAGTIRYWAVTAIKEGTYEESLAALISSTNRVPSAGTPTTLTWNTVGDAISYNVYRSVDGQTYGLINSSGGTPVSQADTSWTDTDETANSGAAGAWVPAAGQLRNPLTISATTKAYDGKYKVKYLQTVVAGGGGFGAAGRVAFYYSRDGEARVFAGYGPTRFTGAGTTYVAAEEATIDVPDNGYSALTIDGVPESQQNSGPPAACTNNANVGSAPNNEVSWWAGTTSFSDAGDTADFSLAPPVQPNLFQAENNYPAAVTHYQQRTVYGGSNAEPEKVYASRTGSFKSFTRSTPLQNDDAVSFALAGKEVNAVKHFLDLDLLIAFTSSEVKVIRGDDAGILRPDAINPKKIAKHGIGTLRPLEVDDSAVYVQSRGNIVRDLKPVASESYEGTDLTVFAAHLFDGKRVVDWDYAETPHSVLWCVLSDGTMVALTYLREHNIWAWSRHETDGDIENVCTVPEGEEDRVYLVVKRTINGATKRYIERMASIFVRDVDVRATPVRAGRTGRYTDMLFMDCLLSYNGWNAGATTMTLTGGINWDELEGLVLTASVGGTFVAGDVGNDIYLVTQDSDGNETDRVRLSIYEYQSGSVVFVHPEKTIPVAFRGVAILNWARAVDQVTGLAHLEGKAVSVIGDGYVVASPNNTVNEYESVVVAAGAITLERPYAVIHVGLPYIGDLETLDIDLPGPRTVKDKKVKVDRVLMMVEESRGIYVGPGWGPTAADPLVNMQEAKLRDEESEFGPVELLTGDMEVTIESSWDSNGRLLVRQVDPLPLTVLSIAPIMSA